MAQPVSNDQSRRTVHRSPSCSLMNTQQFPEGPHGGLAVSPPRPWPPEPGSVCPPPHCHPPARTRSLATTPPRLARWGTRVRPLVGDAVHPRHVSGAWERGLLCGGVSADATWFRRGHGGPAAPGDGCPVGGSPDTDTQGRRWEGGLPRPTPETRDLWPHRGRAQPLRWSLPGGPCAATAPRSPFRRVRTHLRGLRSRCSRSAPAPTPMDAQEDQFLPRTCRS